MNRSPELICRIVVQSAWRRRYPLSISFLAMFVFGVAAAKFMPQHYQTTSLMLLQESAKSNPLDRDTKGQAPDRMREKIAGLQALLYSERVLTKALHDMEGERFGASGHVAEEILQLRKDLSLDLLGTDFLAFRLKGDSAYGLGNKLETITSSFLEALLPEENGVSAAQILLRKRKIELDNAELFDNGLRSKLQNLMPDGIQTAVQQATALDNTARERSTELAAVEAELGNLARSLKPLKPNEASSPDRLSPGQPVDFGGAKHEDAGDSSSDSSAKATPLKRHDLESKKDALVGEFDVLKAQRNEIQQSLDMYKMTQIELEAADKALAKAKENYSDYARRYGKSSANHDEGILNAPDRMLVIDEPKDPELPTVAGYMYVIGGMISGLVLGTLLATAAEYGETRIRYAHELVELTRLPILAALPHEIDASVPQFEARLASTRRLKLLAAALTAMLVAAVGVNYFLGVHVVFRAAEALPRIDLSRPWELGNAAWSSALNQIGKISRR